MAVITISRQYGSGGDEIVSQVCAILGYRHFDKQMIHQMVSWENLSPDQPADFHEDTYKMRSFFDRLRGYRPFPGSLPKQGAGAAEANEQVGENLMVWLTEAAIRAAYDEDNIAIVGRGGQAVLYDKPGVLHVRIEAPLAQRVQWAAEHEQITLPAARQSVARHDNSAAEYVKRFYGANWADPQLYHIVLNTGCWTVEAAAQIIVAAVQSLVPASTAEAVGAAAAGQAEARVAIAAMRSGDWPAVSAIYGDGIATGQSTFETEVPNWTAWDVAHLAQCRLVARDAEGVAGWAALGRVSARGAYSGVAEVSVYVAARARNKGVGAELLRSLITESEKQGFWTLQSSVFPENEAGLRLHTACGFRVVGRRECIGQLQGAWRDTVLLERRSTVVGTA